MFFKIYLNIYFEYYIVIYLSALFKFDYYLR